MKNLIYAFLFVISLQCNAQTAATADTNNKLKISVSADRSMQIEFPVDKNVYNVLVLLVDDSGNTVFLDNQYNFKGIYKRNVDLSKSPIGNYYLKVSNDDAVVTKKLSFQ